MSRDKLRPEYTLEHKKYDAKSLESWLRYLNAEKNLLKLKLNMERKKMDHLQLLLKRNAYQKKPIQECLSAQEMKIHKLNYRMVHGSKSLTEENQLLKNMKLSLVWRFDPAKQIFLSHHKMPFPDVTGDAVIQCIQEFSDLEWKKESFRIILGSNLADNYLDGNPAVKRKTSTSSLGLKKELQQQVRVAVKKIEELKETQVALCLGRIIDQVERELKAMKRGIDPTRNRFPYQIKYEDYIPVHPSQAQLRSSSLTD